MKYLAILLLLPVYLSAATRPMTPYLMGDESESRREQALKEKAEKEAASRRMTTLLQEYADLKKEVEQLNQELTQKDELIKKQKTEITALTDKIQILESKTDVLVYSRPFFDVYLGELAINLNQRLSLKPETVNDPSSPSAVYVVQTKREELNQVHVYTRNNRVFQISAFYKDSSSKNYEAIKGQLEKTFTPVPKSDVPKTITGDAVYSATIDGIDVFMVLDRSVKTNGQILEFKCIHESLLEEIKPEKTIFGT